MVRHARLIPRQVPSQSGDRRSARWPSGLRTVEAWDVTSTPTLYVIDREGVIRARNLPWDESVKLVEELVAQAERAAKK